MSILDKPANLIVPTLLFILLTPGLLFTLPNNKQTIIIKSVTHAIIFLIVYALLRILFAKYY
jgi:hypothetical protein